jgi:hypothetical protein
MAFASHTQGAHAPCSSVTFRNEKSHLAVAFPMLLGGEGGIRLHAAGRAIASTRWPSPPTRRARRRPAPLSRSGMKKATLRWLFPCYLAERVGFEPTVRSHVRLISSQVHSTTLPPLQIRSSRIAARGRIIPAACRTMQVMRRNFFNAHPGARSRRLRAPMQQVEAPHKLAQHDPVQRVAQHAVLGAGIDIRVVVHFDHHRAARRHLHVDAV